MRNTLKAVILATVAVVSVAFASAALAARVIDIAQMSKYYVDNWLGTPSSIVSTDPNNNNVVRMNYCHGISCDIRVGGNWRVFALYSRKEFFNGEIVPAGTPFFLLETEYDIVQLCDIKTEVELFREIGVPANTINGGHQYPAGVKRNIRASGPYWEVYTYPGGGTTSSRFSVATVVPAGTPVTIYRWGTGPDRPVIQGPGPVLTPTPKPGDNPSGDGGGGGCDSGMGCAALLLVPLFFKRQRS